MSSSHSSDLLDELETAKELARRAGDILLGLYGQSTLLQWKGRGNPVTAADQASSRFITQELERRFSRDAVLSEEERDNKARLAASRVWIVDPMDGTTEFVAHRDEFAVMIGLAIDGKPLMGVVYQPTESKLYYAAAGSGAFLEQHEIRQRLHVSTEGDSSRLVAAVSRTHDSTPAQQVRDALQIRRTLQFGSAGLKIGKICEGIAHLYVVLGAGTSQWDTCAPEAILHEAGGRITDIAGNPLQYNVPEPRNLHGVVASNGVIHDQVINAVRPIVGSLPRKEQS
jgi:3'(2'), 5'-bisphosphate nucleotidase